MTKNKSKKSAPKSGYLRTSIANSTALKMNKDTASFIGKLAEKDSKRKKKKEALAKKTEDGIVRRLAKNGLIAIDKDKVKAARKSSSKIKKKKKGAFSSSSAYSDSSSLVLTPPATRTAPRAMARRRNRRKRSLAETTATINPRPKLRAKLKKKIRYRSLHNPWKKPKRACSIWLQSFVS